LITVIGSINLDLIANVTRLPAAGETVPGDDFRTAPGGKGANQALAAARAGGQVRMIGAVGKDAFAAEALACLKKGEVVLLQHEIPIATVRKALATATAAGAISVLNTAPFRADAADLLASADYVVANETEFDLYADALELAGGDRAARMRTFVEKTGRTVIVTLGGDGVLAATPKGDISVPALKIMPVDTVGAGDTFCGYLGAGLSAGLPLEQALRRAAAAGSLACLKPGAQPAIPHGKDVDAALAKE
jgi:ribokinase